MFLKCKALLLVVVPTFFMANFSFGQISYGQGDYDFTLERLNGTTVGINLDVKKADEAGLFASDLRTDVELKLRLAGIKVFNDVSRCDGHLYVTVLLAGSGENDASPYGGILDVSLQQTVKIMRVNSPTSLPVVSTWESRIAVMISRAKMAQYVRAQIQTMTDEFINAYLSVNPKR